MKKFNCFLIVSLSFMLFILGSCSGIIQPDITESRGIGFVRLNYSAGRTILPSEFVFPGNELTFTPVAPVNGRVPMTFTEFMARYDLPIGPWDLTVKVFTDAQRQNLAAESQTPVRVNIVEGEIANVQVPLLFSSMTGNGNLTFAITNNTGIVPDQTEIKLQRLAVTGDFEGSEININAATLNGNRNIPAGHYLVTIRMEKYLINYIGERNNQEDYQPQAGINRWMWNDILHIYPGQTTNLTHTFATGNFFFKGIEDVWLFSEMTSWDVTENDWDDRKMNREPNGTFTWTGRANADAHFRFALTDTSYWTPGTAANRNQAAWFVPTANGDPAAIGLTGNEWNFIPLYQGFTEGRAWKLTAAGDYKITLDPVAMKFFIERPVVVDTITIDPNPAVLSRGRSYPFTATLTGTNTVDAVITWTVSGGAAGTAFGTGDNSHILTIHVDDPATSLTIKAAAGGKEHEVTRPVQVQGSVEVTFTIEDLGEGLTITDFPSVMPTIYRTGTPDEVTFVINTTIATHQYIWFVGNRRLEEPTGGPKGQMTFKAEEFALGYHSVRVTVLIDGIPWSMPQVLGFTVAGSPSP